MHYRFVDQFGNDTQVTSLDHFVWLVRSGRIRYETALFDHLTGQWRIAGELSEFRMATEQAPPPETGSVLFAQPRPAYEEDRRWAYVLSAVAILVGIFLIFRVVINAGSPYAAGYKLGQTTSYTLMITLASFLVWRFALKKSKGIGLLMFSAGFLLVAALQSQSFYRESDLNQAADAEVTAVLEKVFSGQRVEQKDFDSKKYGNSAALLKVLNDYIVELQTEFANMGTQVEVVNPDHLLTAEVLNSREGVARARTELQSAVETVDHAELFYKQKSEELPARIASADAPESIKRSFIKGFNNTKDQGLKTLVDMLDLIRSMASEEARLLDFVESRRGMFHMSGMRMNFRDYGDYAAYNEHVSKINGYRQQLNGLILSIQQKGQEQLKKFRQQAGRY